MRIGRKDPRELAAAKCYEILFRTTTTLGVRPYAVERAVLERDTVYVRVCGQAVPVKRERLGSVTVTATPEHRDLVEPSWLLGVPVRRLREEASPVAHPGAGDTPKTTG